MKAERKAMGVGEKTVRFMTTVGEDRWIEELLERKTARDDSL